jgi:hypothetical protein
MAEEDKPDEQFGETIREETRAHSEPPPKPSILDVAKERVGKSVESFKAQRAAESAERKEIEAEKKAAIEQARRDRKEEEKAKEIQQAYENERTPRRTPSEKLAAGFNAIQPFLSGMKQGIATQQPSQMYPPKRFGPEQMHQPLMFTGSNSGGFDITTPQKPTRFSGSSGVRLAILDQPVRSTRPPTKAGKTVLQGILFGKPARNTSNMGRKGSLPSLFRPSKMGVQIPKGGLIGLNLPKQGGRGRKSKSIFGY